MKKILFGTIALLALAGSAPALAADIPAPVYKAPVMVPLIYSWTGFYVGANVGYSWGRGQTDFTDSSTTTITEFRGVTPCVVPGIPCGGGPLPAGLGAATVGAASGRANINGFLGGLQAGYNAQYNSFVFGIEADIQATGQRGSVTLCDTVGCPLGAVTGRVSEKLPWFATFRGRVGFTPAPKWLLYLTGGLALAEIDQDVTAGVVGGVPATLLSTKTTRAGWVFGGGVEAAVGDSNWTIKAEYLHMDFGTTSSALGAGTNTTQFPNVPIQGFNVTAVTTTTAALNTRVTDDVVRVGLNYRFMATDAVVVRKY